MPQQPFITKTIERIERIDKQHLIHLVNQLLEENHLLSGLMDQIAEGLFVLDTKGRIRFSNEPARRLLSASAAPPSSTLLERLVDDEALRALIFNLLGERRETYDESVEILSPRYTKLKLTSRIIKTSDQETPLFLFLLFVFHDEENKREEQYRHERVISILSLASGIAHEIGNPLNSINIHLHLLAREIEKLPKPHQHKLKRYLKTVEDETKRLDQMVRNFLKTNRRKPVHFELGNIHDVLRDVLILYEPELKRSRITTETRFDSELPVFFIDVERLHHVFGNLVKNAIEAMPKGGKLHLVTQVRKSICEISIADTGVGMDRGMMPKIFDAYYTTKGEGSGLGLVIAYQIIREHAGRMEVASQPGRGTTVHVFLPIRKQKLQLPGPNENQNRAYI